MRARWLLKMHHRPVTMEYRRAEIISRLPSILNCLRARRVKYEERDKIVHRTRNICLIYARRNNLRPSLRDRAGGEGTYPIIARYSAFNSRESGEREKEYEKGSGRNKQTNKQTSKQTNKRAADRRRSIPRDATPESPPCPFTPADYACAGRTGLFFLAVCRNRYTHTHTRDRERERERERGGRGRKGRWRVGHRSRRLG